MILDFIQVPGTKIDQTLMYGFQIEMFSLFESVF